MKLFCLTYAGGNASFFNPLDGLLYPSIELLPMEYAGHGSRHREGFYGSFDELAADMSRKMAKAGLDGGYAIIGYSMGSVAALEVLRKLASEGCRLPSHLFLAAHGPQTLSKLASYNSDELDQYLKDRTIRFGGVPQKLIDNKAFWRMYLPVYRADYSILSKYDFGALRFTSTVPATVFYSESDTPFQDISQWKNVFQGECDFFCYEGNHFFFNGHYAQIAKVINSKLAGLAKDVK